MTLVGLIQTHLFIIIIIIFVIIIFFITENFNLQVLVISFT